MGKQNQSASNNYPVRLAVTDHPLFSTGKINISDTPQYYEAFSSGHNIGESSPISSDSVTTYNSSCGNEHHTYAIRKIVPTEPYWKRVGNALDKNKKNIMMGCVMFVLVSLFIVSTIYFVKSFMVNNIVLLSICAIMSLLAALVISILIIIWLTKYSKLRPNSL